jgi:hypothetical protein
MNWKGGMNMETECSIAALRNQIEQHLGRVEELGRILSPTISILIATDEMLEECEKIGKQQMAILSDLCSMNPTCDASTDQSPSVN